jgi:hemerythrin-like domain-containing protein
MLRDRNLVPLSRQHQHALALCVRIDRASGEDAGPWLQEIEQHFTLEIRFHFAAEEEFVFPLARRFPELAPLVDELLAEHASLRGYFQRAAGRDLSLAEIKTFAGALSAHIRKEERQLFEHLQKRASAEEMRRMGDQVDKALEAATLACVLPRKPSGS